jgi:hypothetical protein
MKFFVVGLVFLGALGTIVAIGLMEASIPVLKLGQLLGGEYHGGSVHVNESKVLSIESLAPLRFTVTERENSERQMVVESRGMPPDNFAIGRDVGLQGRFDPETRVFHAYRITTQCPSRYEASKEVGGYGAQEPRLDYPAVAPLSAPPAN